MNNKSLFYLAASAVAAVSTVLVAAPSWAYFSTPVGVGTLIGAVAAVAVAAFKVNTGGAE